MNKEIIGFNAGKIWQRLEGELTDTNLNRIKKECKLKELDFFLALGWLARENKIKFFEGEKNMYVFPYE